MSAFVLVVVSVGVSTCTYMSVLQQQVLSLCKLNLDDDDARAIAQGLSASVSRNQAGAGAGGWTLKQAQQNKSTSKRGRGTATATANAAGGAQGKSGSNYSNGGSGVHPTGQLRRLLLSENAIGDEGCAAIVAALKDRDHACLDALKVRQSKAVGPHSHDSNTGQNANDLRISFGSTQKEERDNDDGVENNKDNDEWLPEGLWELDLSHNRITDGGAAQILAYLKSANGSCSQEHHSHHHHGHPTERGHHTRALATASSGASRREAWPIGQGKDTRSRYYNSNNSSDANRESDDDLLDSLGPLGPRTSCSGSSLVRLALKGNLVKDSVAHTVCGLLRDFPYLEVRNVVEIRQNNRND